jgi:hypothetical protein
VVVLEEDMSFISKVEACMDEFSKFSGVGRWLTAMQLDYYSGTYSRNGKGPVRRKSQKRATRETHTIREAQQGSRKKRIPETPTRTRKPTRRLDTLAANPGPPSVHTALSSRSPTRQRHLS